jgi:hypothetical protein
LLGHKVELWVLDDKSDAQGLSTSEGLTFQIQNGKRMIIRPKHIAEAKYILPMPRWEERAKK